MKFNRNLARKRRHDRVRKRVHGTAERPRLNIYRSNLHIYAQVINDDLGHTLAAASSADTDLKDAVNGGNIAGAQAVGRKVAERAKEAGVEQVVFDRGGYLYHGRIKALADAAREAGLDF
ncbi:MAG: 50S ribosomal protein L18 [Armatimonadaceae bacterium]